MIFFISKYRDVKIRIFEYPFICISEWISLDITNLDESLEDIGLENGMECSFFLCNDDGNKDTSIEDNFGWVIYV